MFEKIRKESQTRRVYIITSDPSGGGMFLRTYGAGKGTANISFISPEDLAGQIARKKIIESGDTIATSSMLSMMILGIIKNYEKEDSVFGEIKDSYGFPEAIQSFIEVMRKAGLTPGEMEGLSREYPASSKKWKELSGIYKSYLGGLKDRNCLDDGDILSMAVKELSEGACGWLKSSKLYLMDDIYDFKLYRELFEVLKSDYGMEKITGLGLSVSSKGSLRRLQEGIFNEDKKSGKVDETARLLVLHDARKEAQEIIRSFVFNAQGGFGENSLAVASYSESVKYISEMLDMADIPAVFTGGLPVTISRTGVAILRLIRFLKDDRNYIPFIKLLEEAPFDMEEVFGKTGESIHRAKLSELFQEVAPAGGPEEWLNLLKKGVKKDKYNETLARQLIKLLEKFKRDFSSIYSRKESGSESAPWREIALEDIVSALEKFAADWLTGNSEKDAAALKNICSTLNELKNNAGDFTIEVDRGLKIIEEKVSSIMIGACQPDGKSLVVMPLRSAGWIYSRNKYFYGMDENSIPRKTSRILFLPEEERIFLNKKHKCGIYGREELIAKDKYIFSSALNTTSDRVIFSYSDINGGEEKSVLPSPFLLEAFESITALAATTENIINVWAKEIVGDEIKQISRGDYERNIIAAGKGASAKLMPHYPNLIAGYETLRKRLDRGVFSDRDGLIIDKELAKRCGLFLKGSSVSNKKADMYSECPFKYFVNYILRAKPADIPEIDRSRWPDPMTRGNIYHGIYCSFLGELKKQGKLPLRESKASRKFLKDIADKAISELKEEYEPPNGYMEEAFRSEVRDNLNEWYDLELIDQQTWLPVYFELPLGKPYSPQEGIPEEGFKSFFEVDGKKCDVTGRIDRIDVDKERNIRITDYKTGKAKIKPGDILKDGNNLQLVFYAKAIESVLKKLDLEKHGRVFVRYYYSTSKGHFKREEVEVTPELVREFDRIMDIIRKASAKGICIPLPDKKGCEYCDYIRICGQLKEYIYAPKIEYCREEAIKDFLRVKGKAVGK